MVLEGLLGVLWVSSTICTFSSISSTTFIANARKSEVQFPSSCTKENSKLVSYLIGWFIFLDSGFRDNVIVFVDSGSFVDVSLLNVMSQLYFDIRE
jgi:hypothetical protein